MFSTVSNRSSLPDDLPAVNARVSYLGPGEGSVQVRVFPPGSGIATERPPAVQHTVLIRDVRSVAQHLKLDEHGFEFHCSPSRRAPGARHR